MHVEFMWPNDLILGIPQVDSEHIAIIAQIEVLRTLVGGERAFSDFHDIALDIKKLSANHFNHEEALMMMFNCADSGDHKKEHKKFIDQITRLIKLYEAGPIDTITKFYETCGNWYIKHIRTFDSTMASHIASSTKGC